MLVLVLLASAPLERSSEPSAPLQGLVFLLRSATSPARSAFFPDLRSALLLADDGDTLILEPGLYTGPGNVGLTVTKDVAIRGRFGALGSVIDCEGAGRAFDFQGAQAIVKGLTIRGGQAVQGGGASVSGGRVLFEDVTFEGNSAEFGGGVAGRYPSEVLLSGCRFLQNSASFSGGGISVGDRATIGNCLVEGNVATDFGGGFYTTTESPFPIDVFQSTFRGNSAAKGGGGISVVFLGNVNVDRCTIVDNETDETGGGVSISAVFGISYIRNSLILGNTARTGGGGINANRIGITNCTVIGNTNLSSKPGGIWAGSSFFPAAIVNSVVRSNSSSAPTALQRQVQAGTTPDLTVLFSNVEGLVGLPTNIDLDPLFVDPASGDYHILSSSPCVDAGLAFSLTNLQQDIDGEPRFQGLSVDIGCDEVPVIGGG